MVAHFTSRPLDTPSSLTEKYQTQSILKGVTAEANLAFHLRWIASGDWREASLSSLWDRVNCSTDHKKSMAIQKGFRRGVVLCYI